MSNNSKQKAWSDDKAERFIYSSISALRPRKLTIATLVQNGVSIPKAEKLYKGCLEALELEDNATLRSSIAFSLSGLLGTLEEAIEAAAARGDFISHTQLLKLKEKTLLDYASQFTDKSGEVSKETTAAEAVLQLSRIFGPKDE
jgi:hypothetical protein